MSTFLRCLSIPRGELELHCALISFPPPPSFHVCSALLSSPLSFNHCWSLRSSCQLRKATCSNRLHADVKFKSPSQRKHIIPLWFVFFSAPAVLAVVKISWTQVEKYVQVCFRNVTHSIIFTSSWEFVKLHFSAFPSPADNSFIMLQK